MSSTSLLSFISSLNRKKQLRSQNDLYETPLRRTLTTFHLTLMGIGAMLGSVIYVFSGTVAKHVTGPAIVISYAISSFASMLSAFCYIEFACRVPRTGSAYTFTYLAVGEVWAFIIGWDLILEYSILAAAMARAFMGYTDSLTNHAISNFTINTIMGGHQWKVKYLAPYPDILGAIFVILISVFISTGAKISSHLNSVLLGFNLIVTAIIVVMGFMKGSIRNWTDYGGFVPNGFGSVIAGAATLYSTYIGFDVVAVANEETIDPKKSIPRAMIISIIFTTIAYMTSSAALTLMVPYPFLDDTSAFAEAFASFGIEWARGVIGAGALTSIISVSLMAQYSLPRSVYAMATDGLLFGFLGHVNQASKVPLYAVLFGTILTIIPTLLFTMSQLLDFLSIGVLMGYSFVAGAVVILRYRPEESTQEPDRGMLHMRPPISHQEHKSATASSDATPDDSDSVLDATSEVPGTLRTQFINAPLVHALSTFPPGHVVNVCLLLFIVFSTCGMSLLEHGFHFVKAGAWWAIILLILFIFGALASFLLIPLHHQKKDTGDYFRVSNMI